jgi:hypothetical protein
VAAGPLRNYYSGDSIVWLILVDAPVALPALFIGHNVIEIEFLIDWMDGQ